jgi:hypothetical protein
MMRRTLALGAVLLFTASACGGSDSNGAGSADTTEGADRTAPDTTAAETTAADTTAPETTAAETTAPDTSVDDTAPDTGEAVQFVDPDGNFAVAFPSEPEEQSIEAPLPDGSTLPATLYASSTADGSAQIASCSEYPSDYVLDPTTSLEGAQNGAIGNLGGELTSSTPIELQGRPGLDFTATSSDFDLGARVFLDGLLLCQVLYVANGELDPAAAAPFLDSFEFLKPAGG